MKKRTIKYTINKTLCGFTIASVLALTSCGKSENADNNDIIVQSNDIIEQSESISEKDTVKIIISSSTEELLVKQLENLQHDIPTMDYKIEELIIEGDILSMRPLSKETKQLIKDVTLSCPYLTSLSITKLHLTAEDLSWVSALTNLTHLDFSCNRIEDTSFLAELINLRYLNLSVNNLVDVFSLSNLIYLEELDISGNNIMEISFIKYLPSLNKLGTTSNKLYSTYEGRFHSREEIEELIILLDEQKSYKLEFLK